MSVECHCPDAVKRCVHFDGYYLILHIHPMYPYIICLGTAEVPNIENNGTHDSAPRFTDFLGGTMVWRDRHDALECIDWQDANAWFDRLEGRLIAGTLSGTWEAGGKVNNIWLGTDRERR